MDFEGRVTIVTGGARGIGGAIARRFAAEGAAVMIADVNAEAAGALVARIAATGGQAQFTLTDVSDRNQVEALFDTTLAAFGRLDILVNNAGIVHGPKAVRHFLEMPEEMWHNLIGIHLNGLFYCSQRAARIMVEQRQGGCIINMSSGGATRAHRQMVAYDTTKGGIEAATRAMALDLAPWQIRVNAIVPGAIAVEDRTPVGQEGVVQPPGVIPLARLGSPEDIAGAAVYLASDDAAYVTGSALFVDGGLTAQLRSPAVDLWPGPDLPKRL
ncbi:MAG: SDR family oxidoreductase [Ardenticatenaceae bacterium]|nr:SDR family oxidoreductase [Ardenticatenaceae bacterium]